MSLLDKFPLSPGIADGIILSVDSGGGAAAAVGSHEINTESKSKRNKKSHGDGDSDKERDAIAGLFCGDSSSSNNNERRRRRRSERRGEEEEERGRGVEVLQSRAPFPEPYVREYVLRRATRGRGGS